MTQTLLKTVGNLWMLVCSSTIFTPHLAHVRPSSYATTLTLTARQLCASLLCFDPQKRATIYDAFGSPWVQSDLEEMSSVYCRRVNDD